VDSAELSWCLAGVATQPNYWHGVLLKGRLNTTLYLDIIKMQNR